MAIRYVALGDSISIDAYTGEVGGGAASQLARRLAVADFENRARDGNIAAEVLGDLRGGVRADLVTLTIGGNDFLLGRPVDETLSAIEAIAQKLDEIAVVILNSVYDPSDGDDSLAPEMDLPPEWRPRFERLNAGIREIAARHGFLLADLEALCRGHGLRSTDTWFTFGIEPNLACATAIAEHWFMLLRGTEDG
ncbi:MAG TPA: SGNH/GDSL hydrolase family protein [Armatimonadota bacterium]|nr:SGNH/GDSL hydrolase family protein [Armatimonadota bacterium]